MRLQSYIETRGRASELARKLEVHLSTITRIAKGETDPSAAMIKRICDATEGEVSPADFFDDRQDA